MRVLVATDAWHPQVNGVVRTLTSLARSAQSARRQHRLPVAGRLSDRSGADLSGIAPGAAEPRQIARRIEQAKPDAIHIATEGTDRLHGAGLLPKARPAVHHQLHDAISRIHLGARTDPRKLDLRGAAPLSCRRDRHDGGDAVADDRARPARLWQSRHVDARRRHRSVPAGPRHRARSSATDLHHASDGSPSKRTSKHFSRSICPAPRSSSAPARRKPS